MYRRTNIRAALSKAHHDSKPVSFSETLTLGDAFVRGALHNSSLVLITSLVVLRVAEHRFGHGLAVSDT